MKLRDLTLTRDHTQFINPLSPIWPINKKVVTCSDHGLIMGFQHNCDDVLNKRRLPKTR
jgi:hypothetical protein